MGRELIAAGEQRKRQHTSIYDRGEMLEHGRTVIEHALTSILDELGDDSRFVEYWWRDIWWPLEVHRDVDEILVRQELRGRFGLQRCPRTAHVLYVDIEPSVRGPTCIWDEVDAVCEVQDSSVECGGPPRALRMLFTVPAVSNRLLRFRGDCLHGVPKGTLEYLGQHQDFQDLRRRAVILFNAWPEAPLERPSADAPSPEALASLAALPQPPRCLPKGAWRHVSICAVARDGPQVQLSVPLLGDARRRASDEDTFKVVAPDAVRSALLSEEQPCSVPLDTLPEVVDAVSIRKGALYSDDDGKEFFNDILAMAEYYQA